MRITLTVVAGPHKGLEFTFARHDTFLVGRSKHAHFQLPLKDKYFSRVHFMVEVNPPQCRLIDMGSHNGTFVNGTRLLYADLHNGDQIRAGHTILKLSVEARPSEAEIPKKPGMPPELRGFKLVRELGRGGMGIVYLANCVADGRQVALKVIAPSGPGSSTHLGRFLDDARAFMELVHPHIVRSLGQGEADGMLYFVTEYVPGRDAGTMLKKDGPLAIKRAVVLICQLLEALEYGHAKNLVHGDIKPANVLISATDGEEVVKVADFGLARVYQASQLSGLSMTADIGDSAGFLPPERITNYREVAPPADQYAAAATLYTLLTGEHVFDLPSEIHRRISLILQAQPVPIHQRRADVSPELAAVLHKALARNPAQRFPGVVALRNALVKAVNG